MGKRKENNLVSISFTTLFYPFLSTLDKFRLSNCQNFDLLESFSYFLRECFASISCLPSSHAFSSLLFKIIGYNILEPGTG